MPEQPQQVGPYVILSPLGQGGMARTYLAVKRGPGGYEQRVCLKRIRQELDEDPDSVRQFLAEARIAARLRHANLAQVLDFGHEEDGYWLALELVDGVDLRGLLARRERPLPARLVVHLLVELATALDVAHRGGVVHRDVSPSNVLLSREGEVKLTDFGIARRQGETQHTQSGVVKGKVPYMAPEYAHSGQFDARCDLFGLGVIAYECLAGHRPYDGATELETLHIAQSGEHAPLGTDGGDVPPGLVDVVEALIDPDPDRRCASASDLLDRLTDLQGAAAADRRDLARLVRECLPSGSVAPAEAVHDAPTRRGPQAVDAALPPTLAISAPPSTRANRRGRYLAALVGASVGLIILGLVMWRPESPPAAEAGQPATPERPSPGASPGKEAGAMGPHINLGAAAIIADAAVAGAHADAALEQAPSPEPAVLTVIVIPYGDVSINGRPARQSPLKIRLPPGTHRIVADKQGTAQKRTVRLEPGQRRRVIFR